MRSPMPWALKRGARECGESEARGRRKGIGSRQRFRFRGGRVPCTFCLQGGVPHGPVLGFLSEGRACTASAVGTGPPRLPRWQRSSIPALQPPGLFPQRTLPLGSGRSCQVGRNPFGSPLCRLYKREMQSGRLAFSASSFCAWQP